MNTRAGKTCSLALRTLLVMASLLLTIDRAATQDSAAASADTPEPGIEGSLGIDITNQYFFRGILQENQRLIVQPAADFAIHLSRAESSSWSLLFGTWNSLHNGPTGSGNGNNNAYYEFDAYAGVGLDFAEHWSSSLSYVSLRSPNSAFDTVHEIDFSLAYDDSAPEASESDWHSGFQPSMTLAWEHDGQSDGGADRGVFLQLGIEPALEITDDEEAQPISVSFPVVAGFSLADYFENAAGHDDRFGFAQAGVSLSTPLDSIPERFGSWSLHGGLSALYLGDNLAAINAGSHTELLVSVGLGISF